MGTVFVLTCHGIFEIRLMTFYPHSLEDPGASDAEESRDEPNTFQESYDDINVDQILNNFQLVGTHVSSVVFTNCLVLH